jgi:hypothetical protein
LTHNQQLNYSIVKNEPGKIRIATAADFLTHIQMSYFDYVSDHCYTQISDIDLENDASENHDLNVAVFKSLENNYSLPFDYEEFDHQPTQEEIIIIATEYMSKIIEYIPHDTLAYTHSLQLKDNIITGFRNAKLSIRFDSKPKTVDILDGLMSGLKWTSLIGNVWNKTITTMVINRYHFSILMKRFKGDDTSIISAKLLHLILLQISYKNFGVRYASEKFSILFEKTEFLRITYDVPAEKIFSYPARVLATFSQRKPWNNDPEERDFLQTLMPNVERLLNRLRISDDLFKNTIINSTKVNRSVFTAPFFLGGLSYTPTPQKYFFAFSNQQEQQTLIEQHKQTFLHTIFQQVKQDLKADSYNDVFSTISSLGISITDDQKKSYAWARLNETLQTTDISRLGGETLPQTHFFRTLQIKHKIPVKPTCSPLLTLFDSWFKSITSENFYSSQRIFPTFKHLSRRVNLQHDIKKLFKHCDNPDHPIELSLIKDLQNDQAFKQYYFKYKKRGINSEVIIDGLINQSFSVSSIIPSSISSIFSALAFNSLLLCKCSYGLPLRLHCYNFATECFLKFKEHPIFLKFFSST